MAAPLPTPSRTRGSQPFFFQAMLLGGFLFIAFMLFALARSIYRDSFQVGSYIDRSLEQIALEESATDASQGELEYAKTPQYQEKIAKELLGLRRPGEEVIVLTTETQSLDGLLPTSPDRTERDLRAGKSVPERWWLYIFGE